MAANAGKDSEGNFLQRKIEERGVNPLSRQLKVEAAKGSFDSAVPGRKRPGTALLTMTFLADGYGALLFRPVAHSSLILA